MPIFSETENYFFDKLSVSPNNDYVGFIKIHKGASPAGYDYNELQAYYKRILTITDPKGHVLKTFDNICDYSWAPNGNRIACIEGEWSEDARHGFISTGAFIYNVDDGTETDIDEQPYFIDWSSHDGNVYLYCYDRKCENGFCVYRYDATRGEMEVEPYRGVHFSPDGTFYLGIPEEWNHFQWEIYKTRNNKNVTAGMRSCLTDTKGVYLDDKLYIDLFVKGWFPGKDATLLIRVVEHEVEPRAKAGDITIFVKKKILSQTHYLYDVNKETITASYDNISTRWVSGGNNLIAEDDGTITIISLTE